MRIEDFDILSYLQSRGIPYSHSGNNVSSGWIGINCQFCIDHSDHLGINLYSKAFSCFKCAETGSAIKLVSVIDGVSEKEAWGIISEFGGVTFTPVEKQYQSKCQLPVGATKKFSQIHLDFLAKRRYDVKVISSYDLYATGPVGTYKHRIIFPVFMNGRMVSFTGRDVTGTSKSPYYNSSEEYSVRDVKQCLYNMDSVINDTAVVVEGPLDAWRIGEGAVATFGTKYTKEQIRLLRGMKRVFVLFDADAIPLAHKFAHDVASFVKHVEVLELSEGDPDNLNDDDVRALRKELGL
jgi:DNA primase